MEATLGEYGFFRVACSSPEHEVAAVEFNTGRIVEEIGKAADRNCQLILFPELCLSGYTCGDLFYSGKLLNAVIEALGEINTISKRLELAIVIGLPVFVRGRMFNSAAFINKGKVLGVVPKSYLPNTSEYYEERWFSRECERTCSEIEINGEMIPFGADLLFDFKNCGDLLCGIEICEDLWALKPPSLDMAAAGANLILNLSASDEYLGKEKYRDQLVIGQSGRCIAAYLYASAGPGESSTDLMFSGKSMIAENGILLAESGKYSFDGSLLIADIDIEKLNVERRRNNTFSASKCDRDYRIVPVQIERLKDKNLARRIEPFPFVPAGTKEREGTCREVFSIQSTALAKRLKYTGIEKVTLGLSGGLDSTLALLVAIKSFEKMGLEQSGIHALIMPGLGTSSRTKSNAQKLAELLNVSCSTISIIKSVEQHFKDISHNGKTTDIVYENAQARERTQILMDYANKINALVIGTGDLSELALGWCTYNGDHISMYGVNSGVPKTLVRYVIEWCSDEYFKGEISDILKDICATPVSPELIPTDRKGNIAQKTEETIGPYELHDFFLYYFVRWHFSPQKIIFLASIAFKEKYKIADIKKSISIFIKRFFENQYKRSCLPDGVKVGSVSLSPRGDWRMPSDTDFKLWLSVLNEKKIHNELIRHKY